MVKNKVKGKKNNNSEKQQDIATTGTVHLLSKGLRLVTYYRILCKRRRGNSYAHAQTLLRTFPSLRLLQMVGHELKEHALKA